MFITYTNLQIIDMEVHLYNKYLIYWFYLVEIAILS